MRLEGRHRSLATALAVVASSLGACVTPYPAADLGRVRELTSLELPSHPLNEDKGRQEADVAPLLAKPLTAENAVRVALLNNRALRGAFNDMGVARGELIQAGLLPNPEVELDLRRPTHREDPLQQDYFVSFDLTHALLTPLRTGVASAKVEAARYRAAQTALQLAFDTRAAFYALQSAQVRLATATRALDAFAAGLEAAQALYEAGNIPEVALTAQEAGYESARAETAEQELAVLDARERLNRLMGLHGEQTQWKAREQLPSPPEGGSGVPENLETQAVLASLELKEMRARLDGLGRRTALERTQGWLPDVSIDGHAEQDDDRWEVGGGVSISVPIFDRRQGATAAAEAQFDALAERHEATAVEVRSAARDLRNRLRLAEARARQYEKVIVPVRRRALQQTQLQFNAMQVGIFQLLQVLRDLRDTEFAQAAALQEYWTARAALDALLQGQRVGMGPSPGLSAQAAEGGDAGGH